MTTELELRRRIAELEGKVEFLLEHLDLTYEPKRPGWPSQNVIDLVWQGKTIEAIKVLREETGMSLKEAKEAVGEIGMQHKDQ